MTYYRIEDRRFSNGTDECGDPLPGHHIGLTVNQYAFVRKTPKGAWIRWFGEERFLLDRAHRRFACATLDEAKESFRARKRKQIAIYQSRIRDAEAALELVEKLT